MNPVVNTAMHTAPRLFLLLLFFLIPGTLVPVQGQNTFKFDCRRTPDSCGELQAQNQLDGVKCNIATGKCECGTARTNPTYNCQETDAATGNCAEENVYGTDCKIDRVQVSCTLEKMFIAINPHLPFTGKIYVFEKSETDACKLAPLTDTNSLESYIENKDALQGYGLELTHTNIDCGNAEDSEKTNTDGDTENVKTRKFFIQYNSAFRTNLDQLITAECIISKDGTKVHSNIQSVKQESESDFDNVDASGNVNIVSFTITDANGQPLQSEIALGAGIKLVFALGADTNFKTFTLTSCAANNTLADDDASFKSIEFLKNSCPEPSTIALFRGGINKKEDVSPVTIEIDLSAFRFAGISSNVAFGCNVKLCDEASINDCAQPLQCPGLSIPESETETGNNGDTSDTNGDTGGDTGSDTNGDTGGNTGSDTNGDTGGNTGSDTNGDTGGNTGSDTNGDTGGNTGSDTNGDTGGNTGSDTNGDTGGNTGSDTNGDTGGNTGSDTNGDTGGNTGSDTNGDTGGNTGSDTNGDTGGNTGSGRRKRAISSNEKVSTVITVYDPLNKISELQEVIESNDCIEQPEIIAVIVILGLSVVLLMILCIILVLRMMRSRKKVGALKSNQVTPVQNFAIPRLEMTGGSRYAC